MISSGKVKEQKVKFTELNELCFYPNLGRGIVAMIVFILPRGKRIGNVVCGL